MESLAWFFFGSNALVWAWGFGDSYGHTLISKRLVWTELSMGGGRRAAGDGGYLHGEHGNLPWNKSL